MGFDAISNAHVYVFPKDSSKKNKGNKMVKSKHNKLDLLREQCLIQVGNKEYKTETNDINRAIHPSIQNGIDGYQRRGNIPRRVRRETHEFLLPIHNNESISWINSSVDKKSVCNDPSNVNNRRRNISSSSSSCSSSGSEEEKRCFDNWERVADALGNVSSESRDGSKSVRKSRAWSPDDVFRPQSLPRISKQQMKPIPVSTNVRSRDLTMLSWRKVVEQERERQSCVCPICCEDLDVTDSSFRPCPCGFRLCLFCHKRINEVDGRCPGCRKRYGSGNAGPGLCSASLRFQMADSCSF
ncbi:hypothetical protein RND81_08G219600 [Saponaria officinalis]|uniref:RING-type domain-containing protein n=1 Tax=Saponaria officinalis TaxID=3572 RepID=A0AAW1JAC0_SAPOF